MQISKGTLYIICPILIAVLFVGYIGYSEYDKKQKEERAMIGMKRSFNKIIENEYNSLLFEYESIVETIRDDDCSYNLRFEYVIKLNNLLDVCEYQNTGITVSTVDNCIRKLDFNQENDKKRLKLKAYNIACSKFRITSK